MYFVIHICNSQTPLQQIELFGPFENEDDAVGWVYDRKLQGWRGRFLIQSPTTPEKNPLYALKTED